MNEMDQQLQIIAQSFEHWSEDDLLDEFGLCTDEMATEQDEEVVERARAQREGLGLALIHRGWTADQLLRYPFGGRP